MTLYGDSEIVNKIDKVVDEFLDLWETENSVVKVFKEGIVCY